MKVAIVTETPEDCASAGRHRRYLTLKAWLSESMEVENLYISSAQPPKTARERIAATLRWRSPTFVDNYVVCGLASPHMLLLAMRLSKRHRVVFDACDSWVLQRRARAAQGGASATFSRIGAGLSRLSPRMTAVTYITERDAVADMSISSRQRTLVVPQAEDPTLTNLPAVEHPLERVSVSVDSTSFHTRAGLFRFLPELAMRAREHGVIVDVYGRVSQEEVPIGARLAGWAPRLSSLYEGNTVVFVTNLSGSGIPNKVVEANAAGRPLILHSSLAYLGDQLVVPTYWFSSANDIGDALSRCLDSAGSIEAAARTQVHSAPPPAKELFRD